MSPSSAPFGWDSFDSDVVEGLYRRAPAAFDPAPSGGLRCPFAGHDHVLTWADGDLRRGTVPCGEPPVTFRASPTFVYENRLDNFIAGHHLVEQIQAWGKAEVHRLGHENSEDALTWNVFRSVQQSVRLGLIAAGLARVESRVEPSLYLWGRRIDEDDTLPWTELQAVRDDVEEGFRQQTEPDAALRFDDWGWVLIEAKFGSPMTTYARSPQRVSAWVERYADRAPDLLDATKLLEIEGADFPEQALRSVVFAATLAAREGAACHVVALVRERDWLKAEGLVRPCLTTKGGESFSVRSWEQLAATLPRDDATLAPLRAYLGRKSFSLRRALDLAAL